MPGAYAGALRTFTRRRESSAKARQVLRDYLRVWGGERYLDDGLLVLGELFANAVSHARTTDSSRIYVHLGLSEKGLLIEVSDADGQRWPMPCGRGGELPDSGRGLAIVAALATWGCRPRDEGVWARRSGRCCPPARTSSWCPLPPPGSAGESRNGSSPGVRTRLPPRPLGTLCLLPRLSSRVGGPDDRRGRALPPRPPQPSAPAEGDHRVN
ncbi:ATP-binding protein [Kitasatospora purpeofusca]|uniref:ATP-binding protein n=1 Tax=Kitasatospora purpeofusca TaxID=67352 RepID=UPI0036EAB398